MARILCAIATSVMLLVVSTFAYSAAELSSSSEPTTIFVGADALLPDTTLAAANPTSDPIDLSDWQPTNDSVSANSVFLYLFIANLYRQYPGESFLFFKFLFHRSPF
jgi:hypothetical protein